MTVLTRAGAMVVAAKAITRGATMPSSTTVKWNAARRCECPTSVTVEGKPKPTEGRYAAVIPGTASQPMWVDIEAPCRRCPACLENRRLEWTRRARAECAASARTWFGTLTLSPLHQSLHLMRCRALYVGFDERTHDERFRSLCKSIGSEVAKWLKRVRKQSRARLRYLVVFERHKSGDPHVHCLVHECSPLLPVHKAVLDQQWTLGFTKFRLVHTVNEAGYVCKYLAKEAAARVRASRFYGDVECEVPDQWSA